MSSRPSCVQVLHSGFSEWVASFGLVLTTLFTLRANRAAVAASVGLYITAASWFTGAASFANPRRIARVTYLGARSDLRGHLRSRDPSHLRIVANGVLARPTCTVGPVNEP